MEENPRDSIERDPDNKGLSLFNNKSCYFENFYVYNCLIWQKIRSIYIIFHFYTYVV